jgi:CheY-like chemotaxis protein
MKKLNFYLIDDSEVNNFYNEDLLNDLDCTNSVTVFSSSQKALDTLLKTHRASEIMPDIILLDIRMPELDGFEFLDELEQELDDAEFTPKIFILTSSKHRKDIESFDHQYLASEFLGKPLEIKDIENLIKKHF